MFIFGEEQVRTFRYKEIYPLVKIVLTIFFFNPKNPILILSTGWKLSKVEIFNESPYLTLPEGVSIWKVYDT